MRPSTIAVSFVAVFASIIILMSASALAQNADKKKSDTAQSVDTTTTTTKKKNNAGKRPNESTGQNSAAPVAAPGRGDGNY
jgi:hypothetical protein